MTTGAGTEADRVQRLVLIVGKGRSGTSLFAGILGRLGFHVPQPEVKADRTNPRGFGEPRWVVRFHKRLMRERRVTVFDSRSDAWASTAALANDEDVVEELRSWLAVQYVGVDNVVVKDPRIVWFLPLWLRCAGDLGVQTSFVTLLRHPTEVVGSARTSYGTWQNDASRTASWLNITLHAEYATRGSRRAFVRYEDLLEDWAREVSRSAELLDLPWLAGIDRARHPEVDAFVDPNLRRTPVGWEAVEVPAALQAMAEDVWRRMSRLADRDGDTDDARAAIDAARAAYVNFYAEAEAVAQSSVTAVKPRRQTAETPARQGRRRRGFSARSLRRMTRLIPARYRTRAPLGGLREEFRASRGLPLVLRLMLLVPLRYRERMPLPVVHAARRVVRGLRR
jgi:hypothetical protein